jgi:glycosyltransferase involved in cell wall biosynthesis
MVQAINPAPTVSVVMTSYRDRADRLLRCVESILQQTFSDFELIIVFEPDDENLQLVMQACRDERLIAIQNPERIGRCACYNRALDLARGRFIARMDGDDWAMPGRLAAQLEFLRNHPDVHVVGSTVVLVNEDDVEIGRREVPLHHHEIMRHMVVTNPIIHPTVLWDASKLGRDLRFDAEFSAYCDDLELWLRVAESGGRFANLREPLLRYRQPPQYCRPRENWRYNFRARRKHWRLMLRQPAFVAGILALGLLSLLPETAINAVTRRGAVSDRLRSIRRGAREPTPVETRHRV